MPASTTLGKRKSRSGIDKSRPSKRPQSSGDEDNDTSAQDAQAIFARFFEAQFEPLPGADSAKKMMTTKVVEDMNTDDEDEEEEGEEDDDSGNDSDDDAWSGVSENEDEANTIPEIEVVSHVDPTSSSTLTSLNDKKARKALLSSKVPSASSDDPSSSAAQANKSNKSKSTPTEEDAPTLLANDLELQRLLNESHLFNPSKVGSLSNHTTHHHSSAVGTEHTGRNRLLANDLRMAALGSKTSIYAQQKMPMSHRKGMNAAAVNRETKRRREARENGIILERPSSGMDAVKKYTRAAGAVRSKDSRSLGDRKKKSRAGEIDAPAVGRMSGGMLKLSKKDIRDIESSGPRRRDGGKGKKKRR